MSDYEALYKQSLTQIQKQKQQIRKLEEQIRQRCQSYLIHSSRYRSRNQNPSASNSAVKTDEDVTDENQLQIEKKTVNLTLQSHLVNQFQNVEQAPQKTKQTNLNNENIPNSTEKSNLNAQSNIKSTQASTVKGNQVLKLQSMLSNLSNISSISEPLVKDQPPRTLQKQQTHPQINWQEVVAGLKQRMSVIQKQKSDQTQKVLDLQQQLKLLKRQQRNWVQANNNSKKKTNKSIQPAQIPSQVGQSKQNSQQLKNLWAVFQGEINLQNCTNLQQKVKQIVEYVKQLKNKINIYEKKQQEQKQLGQKYKSLQSSQVQDYNYNFTTPYRKIKEKQSKQSKQNSLARDVYQIDQLQNLRRKCKQLQSQLSSLSRVQRNLQTPQQINEMQQQQQNQQQQVINDPPYIIQQQLQKPTSSPYVKRSFVRKKVVKRNLSAMILRTPSKSKEQSKQSKQCQLQKLKKHLQKSKNGQNDNQVQSLSRKIQRLQNNIEAKQKYDERIEQISDENSSLARASGISQDNFTEIIQVQTEGPGFKNYTAHILGLNKKDKSMHQKKIK